MPKYSLDNLRKPGRPKGTTGPNKPAIAKKRAGSWTERKKPAPPPIKIKKLKPRPIRGLKRLCQTKIPGYDPWRDAGDCHFDQKAARHAIEWIEGELSHVKGAKAREPFLLEDWQRAIIATLFGWKRPDGTRRYRYAFVFVPRKNGKTALAACIILYCLFEDGEAGAEIYGAASEYRQASKVWEHAAGMVRQNPKLLEKAQIFRGQAKAIQRRDDFSTYAVLASSPEALSHHGGNTHVFVVDELHALSDNEMVDVLETSTGSRRQPLGVYITTSDYEREGSPCNEKHDYAGKVRDGIIRDAAFLPVIYEAARKDDWSKPAVWRRCNPNFGVSVYEEYIVASYAKARELPRFENTFKRLHLNIRTEQAMRWLPMDKWDACAGEPLKLEDFAERQCWGGLDLATTRDMTALVLAFQQEDGTIALIPIFWIPRENAIARERRDRVPYLTWIKQGWIRATEGDTWDPAVIRRDINELIDDHRLRLDELALDRLFQGDQLGQELSAQDGLNVVPHGQGFLSMAAPTKRFEDLVVAGKLRHGGNPVLRWHASNAAVEEDAAGNLKPSRKKSMEKIDGIVAAIMAVGRTATAKKKARPAVVWV